MLVPFYYLKSGYCCKLDHPLFNRMPQRSRVENGLKVVLKVEFFCITSLLCGHSTGWGTPEEEFVCYKKKPFRITLMHE